jgi:hypothetical protein
VTDWGTPRISSASQRKSPLAANASGLVSGGGGNKIAPSDLLKIKDLRRSTPSLSDTLSDTPSGARKLLVMEFGIGTRSSQFDASLTRRVRGRPPPTRLVRGKDKPPLRKTPQQPGHPPPHRSSGENMDGRSHMHHGASTNSPGDPRPIFGSDFQEALPTHPRPGSVPRGESLSPASPHRSSPSDRLGQVVHRQFLLADGLRLDIQASDLMTPARGCPPRPR